MDVGYVRRSLALLTVVTSDKSCAPQRETPEDRVDLGREWGLLTRTFLGKWSEAIEDSLSNKVIFFKNFVRSVERTALLLCIRT